MPDDSDHPAVPREQADEADSGDEFDLWVRFHEAVDELPQEEREVVGLCSTTAGRKCESPNSSQSMSAPSAGGGRACKHLQEIVGDDLAKAVGAALLHILVLTPPRGRSACVTSTPCKSPSRRVKPIRSRYSHNGHGKLQRGAEQVADFRHSRTGAALQSFGDAARASRLPLRRKDRCSSVTFTKKALRARDLEDVAERRGVPAGLVGELLRLRRAKSRGRVRFDNLVFQLRWFALNLGLKSARAIRRASPTSFFAFKADR